MFYLLLTGTYPFELSVNGIMSFINQIKFMPFKINPQFGINQDLASLVEKMLLYSPIERIGFPELL
jgi:serine/threonine protein kinase